MDALLHLCDNDGTRTNLESRSSTHLALDEGSMDWKTMLKQILENGYTGVLDIDAWEHADPFGVTEVSKKKLDEFLKLSSVYVKNPSAPLRR